MSETQTDQGFEERETLKRNEIDSTKTDNNIQDVKIKYIRKVFVIYCLMAICVGIIEPLGPMLYIELQHQLNTSEQAIAFCFTTRSIASLIAAIVSGKVIDYFIESHRYIAIVTLLFIAAIIYLPFTKHIYALHIVFAIVGYTLSMYFVVIFVYVLRLYSEYKRQDAGHKLYVILGIYGITKTIYPLLIQLSLQYTNKYIYPLYAMLILFFILIILLLIFKTPKHDKLRTIKAEIKYSQQNDGESDDTKDAKDILKILNKDKKNRLYEVILILILSIIELCCSAMQEYFITFVTVYCEDLNIGQQYGRYLMSTYFAGQLLYRIVNALIIKCKELESKYQMLISLTMLLILSFIFLFIYSNIIWMFFFWFLSGFFAAAVVPEIEIWTELIKPVTGTIEIIYCLMNAAGEVVAVFGFGILIQKYSVSILKYLIFIFSGNGFVFVVINIIIYSFYLLHKKKVIQKGQNLSLLNIESMQHRIPMKTIATENPSDN